MKTAQYHKRIDSYLSSLPTESDKLTQFYDASIIAKNVLIEVDKLEKTILNLQSIIDNLNSLGRKII